MTPRTEARDRAELAELAAEIVGYVDGWDKGNYLADRAKQRTLERTLELLGEVATRLGDGVPEADINWRNLRNLRVRLAHAYHDNDAARLWVYADVDVRRLRDSLR